MFSFFFEIINLGDIFVIFKVIAKLIGCFNQVSCFFVLFLSAKLSQLFDPSYYILKNPNYILSIIILLREVIEKVMFFLAISRFLMSEHMDLTISSDIVAFCLTLYILSIMRALSSLTFLSSSLAFSDR